MTLGRCKGGNRFGHVQEGGERERERLEENEK